ncbi:hypothetical protein V8C86DRAFT_2586558 [Haematococcus lacustris]
MVSSAASSSAAAGGVARWPSAPLVAREAAGWGAPCTAPPPQTTGWLARCTRGGAPEEAARQLALTKRMKAGAKAGIPHFARWGWDSRCKVRTPEGLTATRQPSSWQTNSGSSFLCDPYTHSSALRSRGGAPQGRDTRRGATTAYRQHQSEGCTLKRRQAWNSACWSSSRATARPCLRLWCASSALPCPRPSPTATSSAVAP